MKAVILHQPIQDAKVIDLNPERSMPTDFLIKKVMDSTTPIEFKEAFEKELTRRNIKA
jgi:hypothetical protein